MRTRERSLHLRFTEQEWSYLMKQCSRSGLKPQAYIHRLIKNKPVKELPPVEYFEVLKNLRQINHNMNQIAVVANAKGFVDTAAYWENMKALQQTVGLMMEGMYK